MLKHVIKLPGAERIDWSALERNEFRLRYSATDSIWRDAEPDPTLVGLREHVRLLCLVVAELSGQLPTEGWDGVAHNLKLAFGLTDLFAQTDMDGAAMWCRPVAEYETADQELAEKHLASTVVFSFVWAAYEAAIDTVPPGSTSKGAKGRDLVLKARTSHIPYLRSVLGDALEFDRGGTDFRHQEMRRMVRLESIHGIAAEHLRQFRNRLAHGDLSKPEPGDWGPDSRYLADADPHLRRFHANARLVLMLIQILAIEVVAEAQYATSCFEDPVPARLALQVLHCWDEDGEAGQLELQFDPAYHIRLWS